MNNKDEYYMKIALEEAEKAFQKGEVPIAAIIVKNDQIIAKAHNLKESLQDPTAHAEVLAIRQATTSLGGWRLSGSSLYVTIEPCPMCAGAIVQARIDNLVYGANDLKAGAAGTLFNIVSDERLNHRLEVNTGVLEKECSQIMKEFFKKLRE
ncbi:tRNA adenosine(34) deaminase TadA [Natroniella acetigena]|uniref:tRNA adenosine(34) deaminase TadA n=1 Tax=Natroniella acetigena TaxID=52004 RepID=UPI00200AC677|nr:tRNA adenosine(34) deaminase TadA [Natroniella acetigena]MCK8826693.1 tRNA adenosine(34) deaminase TadA [Natroniella acetigena]